MFGKSQCYDAMYQNGLVTLQHVRYVVYFTILANLKYCKRLSFKWKIYAFIHNKRPWKAPPFSHIFEIKFMKLVNIFMSPKIIQKRSKQIIFSLETLGKHPFPFWLLLRGKCINRKKLNVRTLPFSCTNWAHQVLTPLILLSGH